MTQVDVGSIVPSTRDLLQVIGTRRKSLALLAMLGDDRPRDEAARLADLNVSAFACLEPGAAMEHVARATKTVPTLCLGAASQRDHMVEARKHGADGVAIDVSMPLGEWDRLAKVARSMRMLPLALARDAASVEAAMKAGARAVLIQASSAEEVVKLAAPAPRNLVVIGFVENADDGAIRALAGKVDAAIVPPSVHGTAAFADLVAEVDP